MFNAVANESAGEWYLGVYCRKCQAPIPVFQDPGRGTAITAGSGKLTVACPRCGKKAQYAAREVITFLVYADRTAPADRAPVNDDHPIDGGALMSESEPLPVLDLAPYEIPDDEPEDVLEFEPDAAPEATVEPAAGLDPGPTPEPGTLLELGPFEVADLDPQPAREPGPDAAPDAVPPEMAALTPVADLPVNEIPASGAPPSETTLADDHAIERAPPVAESEPVLELAPQESPPPEPVLAREPERAPDADVEPAQASDLDAALDLEAFFEASPVPEAAPAVEVPPAATESAEPQIAGRQTAESEPTPAPEPERAPPVDVEPVSQPERDAALDLEAFFEASPVPETAPAFETPADVPEPAAVNAPAGEAPAAEPEPVLEHVPHEQLAPEPAPAIELERGPEADVAPIGQSDADAALELEAFFEASPVAEPAPSVETQAEVPAAAEPAASEAFAREALVSKAPTVEIPAADIEPVAPAPVETAAAEPPPPPPPAPPKPIAVIYRERWADAAGRPQIIRELRPLIQGLRARAEAQRYDVLVRVTDLFMDYLVEVAPERQGGAAIEQYIHAVFALSARGRERGTDRIGEEMAATLRALNRHAGLYTHR